MAMTTREKAKRHALHKAFCSCGKVPHGNGGKYQHREMHRRRGDGHRYVHETEFRRRERDNDWTPPPAPAARG